METIMSNIAEFHKINSVS